MNNVAMIIPAYGEGGAVRETIERIPKEIVNIICVDDGSLDDTAKQAGLTRARIVKHSINLGQGAAIQTGIEYALLDPKIEFFVTFDADGQHRIEDVLGMIRYLKKKHLDIVLGSRFLGNTENMDTRKKIVLKLAVIFSNLVSGIKLTDTHNGLRVFNRKAAEALDLRMADFSHASEIINKIGEQGLKYDEYPVTIIYTDHSKSKGQSAMNAINIGFDVLISRLTRR